MELQIDLPPRHSRHLKKKPIEDRTAEDNFHLAFIKDLYKDEGNVNP